MQYALYGFLLGFIIPYMARRFAKFMPASAAESIWHLLYPHKLVEPQKRQKNARYRTLIKAYFWRSFIFGLTGALLFTAAKLHFEALGLPAICAFLWALLLLFEIDYKTFLLPDVITIPLLIGGFCFSVFTGVWVLSAESAIGAATGFILPTLAELLIVWKYKNALGLGDIKLLAAIGAWLGVLPVIYVLLLSCIIFGSYAYLSKRKAGAFGPAIAPAAIIVAFYIF